MDNYLLKKIVPKIVSFPGFLAQSLMVWKVFMIVQIEKKAS